MIRNVLTKRVVPAGEFKARCLQLMDEVKLTGQPIEVTKRGKAVVQIVPPPRTDANVAPLRGAGKGYLQIRGDVTQPAADIQDWNVFHQ